MQAASAIEWDSRRMAVRGAAPEHTAIINPVRVGGNSFVSSLELLRVTAALNAVAIRKNFSQFV